MLAAQLCLTFCGSMDYSPPGSLSMGFPRQEYWSWLPFPSPGDLPDPGIESRSPALQVDSLPSELPGEICCWYREILFLNIDLYPETLIN